MATANYRKPNPNLERLISLLGIAKPSHGYTVAESAPEVVTAPGVYFPAESGEVVPLKPPSIPGLPKAPTGRSYSMLPEASKLGGSNYLWQGKYTPRQGGGSVSPTAIEMRKKQGEGFWQADIGMEETPPPPPPSPTPPPQPKKEPDIIDKLVDFLRPTLKLYSRQMGGETDPTLFKNQFSFGVPGNEETAQKGLFGRIGQGISDITSSLLAEQQPVASPTAPSPTAMEMRRTQGPGMWQADIGMEQPAPAPPPTTDLENQSWFKNLSIFDRDRMRKRLSKQMPLLSRQGGGRVFPAMPEEEELIARERWEAPGYPEEALTEARGALGPNVVGVLPGFQKSYYEAHPEERMMDLLAQENKPAVDAMQKALEDARSKSQGFGLMGLRRKDAAAARLQASKDVADITQNLSQMATAGKATGPQYLREITEKPAKPPAPHLVQNAAGEYVWATPGGVLPAGIMGKMPQPGAVSNEELVRGDLKARLKREPTHGEVLDEIDRRKLSIQMGGIPPLSPDVVAAPKTRGVKNEATLEGLTEEQKGIVRGLTSYKYPWPGSFAMRDPKWQALMGRAEMYDPDFSAPEYQARYNIRKSFTSGKEKDDSKALNTATGHIDSLVKASKDLANSNWVTGNAALNLIARHFPVSQELIKRQGKVTSIKTKFNAVADEMAAIFKRTGATDTAIKHWRNTIEEPATATPEMWKGFIDGALELMGSRIEALRDIYESGMGRWKDFRLLSEGSRKILSGMGVDVDSIDRVTGEETAGGKSVVERRRTKDGRVLVKFSDDTVEEEK